MAVECYCPALRAGTVPAAPQVGALKLFRGWRGTMWAQWRHNREKSGFFRLAESVKRVQAQPQHCRESNRRAGC